MWKSFSLFMKCIHPHVMMTSSNESIFRVTSHRSSVNSPHKGQWGGAFIFSLICTWSNGWVNNREAGEMRRQLTHYDVIVMYSLTNMLRGSRGNLSWTSVWFQWWLLISKIWFISPIEQQGNLHVCMLQNRNLNILRQILQVDFMNCRYFQRNIRLLRFLLRINLTSRCEYKLQIWLILYDMWIDTKIWHDVTTYNTIWYMIRYRDNLYDMIWHQTITWYNDGLMSTGQIGMLSEASFDYQWPLLLTWFNFNPSMDK